MAEATPTAAPAPEKISLAKKIAAQGGAMVECPVGGTVTPARDGKLLGLVGGANGDVENSKVRRNCICVYFVFYVQ